MKMGVFSIMVMGHDIVVTGYDRRILELSNAALHMK